jgi:tRNA pseudouridine32 synthase / 23S rRNA pseudouridine746 synthase
LTSDKSKTGRKFQPKGGIIILHEDNDLIVIEKPAGLPTIGSERDKIRTAHTILNEYIRKGDIRSKKRIYVVHRLDRDTSGILVFAKSEQIKTRLQTDWPDVEKRYLAVVYGTPSPSCGTYSSYLAENKAYRVYSTNDAASGKLSHTEYIVRKEQGGLCLLEIKLLTGRKHQIRVHMSENWHPLVGDKKYGRQNDPHNTLALHSFSLAFRHPASGKMLSFTSPIPVFFTKLVGNTDVVTAQTAV